MDHFANALFDSDGLGDIATFYDYPGSETRIHVFKSTGSSFSYSGAGGWWSVPSGYVTDSIDHAVSGDFNGDGKTDIATFYDYPGSATRIHVFLSDGSKFNYQGAAGWWGVPSGYVTDNIDYAVPGDFNGDGKTDIAIFYDYPGSATRIHVFLSNGSKFNYQGAGGWWSVPSGYVTDNIDHAVPGDFNGDGKTDIATFYDYPGSATRIHVFLSDGSKFNYQGASGWWSVPSGYVTDNIDHAVPGDSRPLGAEDVGPAPTPTPTPTEVVPTTTPTPTPTLPTGPTPTSAPGTPTDTPTPRPPTNTPTPTPTGSAPQPEVKFSANGASIPPGATAKVTVRADSPAPGIGAYTVDVFFDPAVVDIVACVPHATGICNEELSPGSIRVTGASVGGLTGDVVLASITFEAALRAVGCSVIQLDVVEVTGPDGSSLASAANYGEICVREIEVLTGDVDCSGALGAVDALLVLQYASGIIDSLPCPENADANGDGVVNSVDAALILQFNAGLIDSLPAG